MDLLGEPASASLAGRSLLPMVEARETEHRLAFTEGDSNRFPQNPRFHYEDALLGRWRSVSDGRYKLIRIPRPEGDELELYDLEADPGERRDLSATAPAELERLRTLLAAWESLVPARERPAPAELSPEELQKLRSLGYVN
jgi:arylsulfatase A-like enzyme